MADVSVGRDDPGAPAIERGCVWLSGYARSSCVRMASNTTS